MLRVANVKARSIDSICIKHEIKEMILTRKRNPAGGHGLDACCECCVLSVRGLCDELLTRPEEFYRVSCVVVCDLETS
jgi:hypothetical protein